MNDFSRRLALKEKIRKGAPTLGLFVKTPSIHIVELLASADVDFIVFDAEHAPFGIETLDKCILAASAMEVIAFVRVDSLSSNLIQSALDMGAAGVIIPHIRSANEAHQAVAATRYFNGTRGFAASHRAAGYGSIPAAPFRESSDNSTIVIGQIEDAVAVNCIDEIATIQDLDALFIGCADLSISFGEDNPNAAIVNQAVDTICEACVKTGQKIGIFLPSVTPVQQYREKGISLFFISSDQALLKNAAVNLCADFKNHCN